MTTATLNPPPLLLPPRQAAEMLSISTRKLWSLTTPRGPIKATRIGSSVRYSAAELQRFVDQQTDAVEA